MNLGCWRMLKRWQDAQTAEKNYWNSEEIVREETSVVLERFSHVFSEIGSYKNWRVLDVGCGPTVVSKLVEGGEKIGVDPLMRHFASKFNVSLFSLGFNFLVGVGEFLPFRDGCFDLIICRNVLDHVKFPGMVLQEIRRVAKNGGVLVLGVYVYPEFVCRLKKGVEHLGIIGLKEQFHPYFFTSGDLEDMLSKHFLVVRKRVVFFDESRWENVICKLLNGIRVKKEGTVPFLGRFRSLISCLFFTLFWNVVRLLNSFKSDYYVCEYVFVGRVRS